MKKAYYLSTCSTCKKILNQINDLDAFDLQDIKTNNVTEKQIEEMKALSGSFESLFSRRAMKYKELKLSEQNLSEKDYKKYILQEYTFLKRPVFIVDDEIFIGNSKKEIGRLIEKVNNVG